MTIQYRHRGATRFWIAALGCLALAGIPAPSSVAQAQDAGKVLPLPAADRQEIEKLLGKGVIGDALPAKPLPPAELYMTGMQGRISYLIRDEKGRTKDEAHEFAKTAGATPESWDYRIGKDRRAIFTKTADGGLVTSLEYDLDKEVVSQFTPGEPLILTGLKPGDSRRTTIHVKVADIDDPTDVDYDGALDVTYSYLGRYRVTVPAGSYDADLIKWTYAGEIGPATIKTAQYRFVAEKNGMVAMVEWRDISAVLIYHDRSRQGKLLTAAK
ncbi:MAG: hypothetical protein E6Q98_00140 [Rhodospirillaceae bacterium]|nr:MAG: hypothetical protein E6Q98_00140 [Rhodospirillaceae bacterium]